MAPGASRLPDAKYSSSVEVKPEIDDVGAGGGDAVSKRPGQLHAGRSHVPGHQHPSEPGEAGEGRAHGPGQVGVRADRARCPRMS